MSLTKLKDTATPSSADAFLSQIRAAILEAANAEGTAKAAAIRCGHLLLRAKESIQAEKGRWHPWLALHDIPKSTADLYMRLAEHEAEIKDCTSIRDARKKLTTPREPTNGVSRREPKRTAIAKGSASPDLAAMLEPLATDEVIAVLAQRFEPDELEELAIKLSKHLAKVLPRRNAA